MNRTKPRRVPVQVRSSRTEDLPASENPAVEVPVMLSPPPPEEMVRDSPTRAVWTQLAVGGVSGLAAILMAVFLAGFPMAATPGVFFTPSAGQLMPTLPLLMLLLLWALAAIGAIVPAVRISRMQRWAAIDESAAPVHPLVARLGGAALWLMVALSGVALIAGWMVFG